MKEVKLDNIINLYKKVISSKNYKYQKPSYGKYDKLKVEMLLKNIPFNLDKVYVKPSKIHGLGVFAKSKIFKDEIITFYPGHYVLIFPKGDAGKNTGPCGIITSDDVEEASSTYKEEYKAIYRFDIDDYYAICGDPRITQYSDYLGHMINDGAKGHSSKNNINQKSNSYFQDVGNFGFLIAIIASRDIEENEEILISYGYNYWTNFSS